MQRRVIRLGMVALLICAVSIGVGQVLAKKPKPNDPPTCPTGAPGCFCPTYYAPVLCEKDELECVYSNQCFAGCAGWRTNQCTPIGPGPVPL